MCKIINCNLIIINVYFEINEQLIITLTLIICYTGYINNKRGNYFGKNKHFELKILCTQNILILIYFPQNENIDY